MGEAILIQNAAGVVTSIPDADGVFYSNYIKPTVYDNIRVDASIALTTVAISLIADINVKLKLGTTTLMTWVIKPVAEVRTIQQSFTYISDHNTVGGLERGGLLNLTVGTAVADANTTVQGLNLYCTAVDA